MLVVVKMPHTENLEIKGPVTKSFMNYLMNEYGEENINTFTDGYEENESVDFRKTAWYKETKAKQTPGKNLRFYRNLCGMTQKQLADELSTYVQNISNMENGRRAISRETAKKLASLFRTSPAHFL